MNLAADRWDEALAALAHPAPLLQSWWWGEVQAREGWSVERVDLGAAGRATVLLKGTGLFREGYVARGPVPASVDGIAALTAWARERGLARIRVEPDASAALVPDLHALGLRPVAPVQPCHTVVVPLSDEDAMLASFKPKHRYNVRLAARRGVTVEEGADASELERQSRGTGARQGISMPERGRYVRRLELLPWCRIYVARHRGEALAAIMVAHHDGRAYYLYGGSSGRHRELMPAYAIQWEAMRAAARAGCRDYDLWGVPPEDHDANHPWRGLWQFKTGFGGRLVEYAGAWELAISPAAGGMLRLREGLRRKVRRLRSRNMP